MNNSFPVVNPNCCYSVAQSVTCNDEEYVANELKVIQKENPTIAAWIEKFSETTADPEGATWCAVVVYKLLKSQAEADEMTKTIKLL